MLEGSLLRTFLAAVDEGSLRGASERVGRTQSAVSMQIQALEAQVGAALLARGARGVKPTAAGSRLVPAARKAVASLDHAMAAARGEELAGALRIGLPEELALSRLPDVLSSFAAAHPGVSLMVRSAPSETLIERLRRGDLDLAVSYSEPCLPGGTHLTDIPMVWSATPQFDPTVRPLPVAVFDHDCFWRNLAIGALDDAGIRWRLVVESQGVNGVLGAMKASLAAGLVDLPSLPPDLAVLGPECGLPAVAPLSLVLHLAQEPNAPARMMADLLRDVLGRPPR